MATATRSNSLRDDVLTILRSLVKPASVTGRPVLIIATGLPGSGKSTFCRRLAQETDAVILESDALRRLLFGQPTYRREESAGLFSALRIAAGTLLRGGASVIVDATNLKERERAPLYELGDKERLRTLIVHVEAPASIIKERLEQRSMNPDPNDNSEAGIEVYRKLARRAQPITRPHWRVDTSEPTETDTVIREILAVMREGGEDGGE